jgi:hypothetical protein
MVDHKDRDGLNNRRENLRPCSTRENNANIARDPSRSGYRGVIAAPRGRWHAQIGGGPNHRFLGSFATPLEAPAAYNRAAAARYGEFATLNLKDGVPIGL